jgi:DNA polymerase alpha subunit B
MVDITEELNGFFAVPGHSTIPPDILGELQSILRLHSISPQELFFKWESYSMKMGAEDTKLDLSTVRAFKKDIQEILERENRGKTHMRTTEKRTVHATPRAATGGDDVFGM